MAGNTPMNAPDGIRLPDPMDVEQLLRREMAVAPSPGFLPRVRARIEGESFSSRWGWRWLVPAGAVAACGALAVAAVLSSGSVTAPVGPAAPSLAVGQPIRMIDPPPVPRTLPAHAGARIAPGVDRVAIVTAPQQPMVIVDERQRAALLTLARIIRDGKLTDESFANTTPVTLQAIRDGVVPLEVIPVAVSPIGGDGVLQRER
jgi:hypothetical protein